MKTIITFMVASAMLLAAFILGKHYLANKPAQTPTVVAPTPVAPRNNNTKKATASQAQLSDINTSKLIKAAAHTGLKPKVLKAALNAYAWARDHHKLGNKDILTVVDFTLPSYEKRMWILSLHQQRVLMKVYTTQGAGSGRVYATRFSNTNNSLASSLGLFVTAGLYSGKHGESMRLDGLQKNINDHALSREIVIHAANYVTPEYIQANHRAGNSWGCFAVPPAIKDTVLNYVKGGSAVFAYANPIEHSAIVKQGPLPLYSA